MDDIKLELHKCALCYDALCNKIYKNVEPERIIRAIRFNNIKGAYNLIKDKKNYLELNNDYLRKCPLHIDINKILKDVVDRKFEEIDISDVDISTEICGIRLENPFLLSSSVIGSKYEMCKRAFEQGWAGVAVKTISLMKIEESSPRFSALKDWDSTIFGFKNIEQLSESSVDENCEIIRKLKEEFPKKVILASIMGRDEEEWIYLTKKVTEAGADIIELNLSCPNMKYKGTGSDMGQTSELVERFTKVVKENTNIPVLAKMTPNITDMRIPAKAAKNGGADGIAAINTIKSINNVNISSFVPEPEVNGKSSLGGYSGKAVKPIALRFIAEMANDEELKNMHFSAMGGIYTWKDAVEFMLLGAESIQITTAVMEYGYRIIDDLILGLKIYMKENNYKYIKDFAGIAKLNLISNEELEKNTVEFPKFDTDRCIGCGRCYISCQDAGHQAIKFNEEERKPILNGSKCVGCHLCKLVCPQNAIDGIGKRIQRRK